MRRFYSPLRYPGGKVKLAPFLASLAREQSPRSLIYAEPFAGGAGAALDLLCNEVVEEVVLNDLNPGIAAFWRALFNETADFTERVRRTEVSVDEWHKQRAIYGSPKVSTLDLGFATFYLNRTNRSGILGARPIGGLKQEGQWRLDARYKREDLCRRIEFIAEYRQRVSICEMEGHDFVHHMQQYGRDAFLYVDPPYLQQGDELYLSRMLWANHVRLAESLKQSCCYWALTYDRDARVPSELYPDHRCAEFRIAHSAAKQHYGYEYLILSQSMRPVALAGFGPRPGTWIGEEPVRRPEALI